MSILIVDDSSSHRLLLKTILENAGYSELILAESAQSALKQLRPDETESPVAKVDLILMDILMPEMDGIEACTLIKADERFRDIPIIMVTAENESEYLQSAFDAGAMDFITKPLNKVELLARVRSALTLKQEMDRRKAREHEIVEIGSKIQQTLLLGQAPRNLPRVQVAALTIPSKRIDGDFYDFFNHNERYLDILIGDVMGKGITAALLGAATKSHFFRAIDHLILSSNQGRLPQPEEIVMSVHEEVTKELINLERFVTLCYTRLDMETLRADFVDCGHTKAILFHLTTRTETRLESNNLPLGFSEEEVYKQLSAKLLPGDLLFFYSDGITEAQNQSGEFFGEDRLADCVRTHDHLRPERLLEQVRSAVVEFSNSETFADDLTCVVIKIEDPKITEPLVHSELELSSDLAELARAREFVQEFCRQEGSFTMEEEQVWQLELAVNEAVSNIIKHAYLGRAHQRIHIEAEGFDDRIIVSIYHWGEAFDPPESVQLPELDGSQESGFGLFLIDSNVDETTYCEDKNGKNCIRLVKKTKRH
jgi:sigma-B regulation protein RsbU (phosphoserine phosphatase)